MAAFGTAAERRTGRGAGARLWASSRWRALWPWPSAIPWWLVDFSYAVASFTGAALENQGWRHSPPISTPRRPPWGNTGWQVAAMAGNAAHHGPWHRRRHRAGQQGDDAPVLLPVRGAGHLHCHLARRGGRLPLHIFVLKPEGLLDPMVWVYALGTGAFFSVGGRNGTLIYGSYLSKEADVPESARQWRFFDSMAAILSALVIIPAMATAGRP